MYKEDFEKERSDRTRTAGKLESLEREAMTQTRVLVEKFEKELSESEAKTHSLEVQLRKTNEDIKTKISQVKQYKKQVEYLQQNLKQQQSPLKEEEMVNKVCSEATNTVVCMCILCIVNLVTTYTY